MGARRLGRLDRSAIKSLSSVDDTGVEERSPDGAVEPSIERLPAQAGLLVVAERRDFLRGCLSFWLGSACGDLTTLAVPDLETSADLLPRARVALIGGALEDDGWLIRQLRFLRERSANLPIVMLVEAMDRSSIGALVEQFGIQGVIPNSSNVNVAAAALRLVMAGGRYFPHERAQAPQPTSRSVAQLSSAGGLADIEKLTPREVAVLNVLGHGSQNKIIAHHLGMSVSTVKAHVHNIIGKLHVHNRTEVVVVAQRILAQASRP